METAYLYYNFLTMLLNNIKLVSNLIKLDFSINIILLLSK